MCKRNGLHGKYRLALLFMSALPIPKHNNLQIVSREYVEVSEISVQDSAVECQHDQVHANQGLEFAVPSSLTQTDISEC